ncbi:MAG: hypothetical protein E7514_01320 [Ruminococcaceae bacterium]|nr:hypothetical protein [Oscillospiraceae bacterium]
MKKTVSLFICLIMLFALILPTAAEGYECSLKTDSASVNVGDTVKISVEVGAGLSGFDSFLTYDTECFEYVDSKEGSLMLAQINTQEAGNFHLVAVASDVVAGGTVYTLTFKVLKLGGSFKLAVVDALAKDDTNVAGSMKNSVLEFKDSGTVDMQSVEKSEVEKQEIANNYNYAPPAESGESTTEYMQTVAPDETFSETSEEAELTTGEAEAGSIKNKDTKIGVMTAILIGIVSAGVAVALIIKKNDKNNKKDPEDLD